MRVHVADFLGLDACVRERHPQGARRVLSGRIGIGNVAGVGRDPVAEQLGVDLRAARLRVLELFERDHRRRLSYHEPVALAVERPRGMFGIVVAPRNRAHRGEAGDPHLRSPAPRYRRRTSRRRDRAESRRGRRRSPCSRRHRRSTATAAARVCRARSRPRPPTGSEESDDPERTQPPGAALVQLLDGLFERFDSAHRCGHRDTGTLGDRFHVESGIGFRLARSRKREMRASIHPPRSLRVHVLARPRDSSPRRRSAPGSRSRQTG